MPDDACAKCLSFTCSVPFLRPAPSPRLFPVSSSCSMSSFTAGPLVLRPSSFSLLVGCRCCVYPVLLGTQPLSGHTHFLSSSLSKFADSKGCVCVCLCVCVQHAWVHVFSVFHSRDYLNSHGTVLVYLPNYYNVDESFPLPTYSRQRMAAKWHVVGQGG